MRIFSRTLLTMLVLATPVFASALTQAEIAAQAQALLDQVTKLQAQLGLGCDSAGSCGPTSQASASAATSGVCPQLTRSLKVGSRGDDVTRLQQYLASDPLVYPEGTVSGYYGSLTEAAVKRWQVKFNIVSSGSAATTGYGVVGPKTAAAIAKQCGTSAVTSGTTSGLVGGFVQVSPITGAAPLMVTAQATVNTVHSCVSTPYALDWGDGTSPVAIVTSAGNCDQLIQSYQHTYTAGGTYYVKLSSGEHSHSATVTVSGAAPAPVAPVPQQTITQSMSASTRYGTVPVAVVFSGVVSTANAGWNAESGGTNTLDFGDGATVEIPLPKSAGSASSFSVQHVYVAAGTYVATLYQGDVGAAPVGTPTTIVVSR